MVIEQQQAISAVLFEDRKHWHIMPSDEELNVLETVVEVLKHVYYLTDALSGKIDVAASALRCILMHMSPRNSDNHVASSMKQAMINNLEDQYSSLKVSKKLDICLFLDPRFNLENKERTILLITEECLSTSFNNSTSLEPVVDEQYTCTSNTVNTDLNLKNDNMESTPMTHKQQIDNEITSYLEFPIAEAQTSPLVWWKAKCRWFPTVTSSHEVFMYF